MNGEEMKKIALVAYDGELSSFAHVMLYAHDFTRKGYDVKVIIEGAATRLIAELGRPEAPFAGLFRELLDNDLLACVCESCSVKMGTFKAAQEQGLPIDGEMKGHPSLERFVNEGYEIITF
jgi:hypothetical protein